MMWIVLLALSCAKEIPPHLRVEASPEADFDATIANIVGSDPLARRPDPGPTRAWASLPQGQALEAWASVARMGNPQPTHWAEVEAQFGGTIAVPLSRGARLAGLEVEQGGDDLETQRRIAAWLGLTRVAARPATSRPSPPLHWIAGRTLKDQRDVAHHMASRWVLRGWLDGPELELREVAAALTGPAYTALHDSPYGRLIRSRAAERRADTAEAEDALWLATEAAFRWAIADGQRAKKAELERRRQYTSTHEEDLVSAKLQQAIEGLTRNASDDDSTGMAIIAVEAARLNNACMDPPCEGIDRVRSIHDARVWGPRTAQLAQVWEIIAIKEALDTISLALDQPILHRRLPQTFEALAGARGEPIQLPWLRHRTENPVLLAAIAQQASGTPQTNRKDTLNAIRVRLAAHCERALEGDLPVHLRDHIQRLRDRLDRTVARD